MNLKYMIFTVSVLSLLGCGKNEPVLNLSTSEYAEKSMAKLIEKMDEGQRTAFLFRLKMATERLMLVSGSQTEGEERIRKTFDGLSLEEILKVLERMELEEGRDMKRLEDMEEVLLKCSGSSVDRAKVS